MVFSMSHFVDWIGSDRIAVSTKREAINTSASKMRGKYAHVRNAIKEKDLLNFTLTSHTKKEFLIRRMIHSAALENLTQDIHTNRNMHTLSANDLALNAPQSQLDQASRRQENDHRPFLWKQDRHHKKARSFESKKASLQKRNSQGRSPQWTPKGREAKMAS